MEHLLDTGNTAVSKLYFPLCDMYVYDWLIMLILITQNGYNL